MKPISIVGAALHNLKNIDVTIPTDKLVVVTGVSGSGKSTLVFDLLFEEGRKRYLEAIGVLSDLGGDRGFDQISGLRPAVAIKQSVIRQSNPRSVVGTKTRILHYLGMLFADYHNQTVSVHEMIQAAHFSFNSPLGMCEECGGRGHVFTFNFSVLLPDEKTTLPQLYRYANMETSFKRLQQRLVERYDIKLTTPFLELPQTVRDIVLYGLDPEGSLLSGLDVNLQSRLRRGKDIRNSMVVSTCEVCSGSRLSQHANEVRVAGRAFGELGHCSIAELDEFLHSIESMNATKTDGTGSVSPNILKHVREQVTQLMSVKLDYLSLYRPIPTLSGGELQRLFLMSYIDADIESLLYIFDEPTAGLHELEKKELLDKIVSLKTRGNAVIIVEHDKTSISMAEHVIDIGPGAGEHGGTVMYQGDYTGLLEASQSVTGQMLHGERGSFPDRSPVHERMEQDGVNQLRLTDVRTNNLKAISIEIPLGRLIGIAGVSGSGKSSLVADTLVPALKTKAKSIVATDDVVDDGAMPILSRPAPLYKGLIGAERIDRCVEVTQEPIGRKSGSNPATYLGVWDRVRKLFAQEALAKERGYTAGHFSFNAAGACELCNGNGVHQIWLGTTHVTHECKECKGKRYNSEILEVQYCDHSITDVLALSVTDALALLKNDVPIARMLDVLVKTGMGYISLGQPASTLSGGEAQRIKLAKEIGRKRSKMQTLYVLDEPSTGLSSFDCGKLMVLLYDLVERGDTVLLVEHDPVMLSHCDWLLELGPAGGFKGGELIAQGSPADLKRNPDSLIGPFL